MSERYIKFGTARSYLREACMGVGSNGGRMMLIRFDNEPTIELPSAEPERKTGKWRLSLDKSEGICTNCQFKIYGKPYQGIYLIVPYKYCPNCGATMEVE